MGGTTIFELLDREWVCRKDAPATTRALRAWANDAPGLAFATMDDLVAAAERRGRPDEIDELLPALLRRAGDDELAARTLLQLLLPGARALARRYAWMGEADEVAAVIITALVERIAKQYSTSGCRSRRGWVAADMLGAARRQLWRRARKHPAQHELSTDFDGDGGDRIPAPVAHDCASEELLELVGWAVARGHLTTAAAHLIVTTRVAGVPIAQLAADWHESPQVTRKRRQRAEARLRDAVLAAA